MNNQGITQGNTDGESAKVFLGINADRFFEGVAFADDFVATPISTTSLANYVVSQTNGTVVNTAAADGGVLVLTLGGANNDFCQIQSAPSFAPVAGRRLAFETKIKTNILLGNDILVGLCDVNADLVGAPPTNIIGFMVDEADNSVDYITKSASGTAKVDSGVDIVADTYIKLGFRVEGTGEVLFYINGNHVGTATTMIPTAALCPTLGIEEDGSGAHTLSIDWLRVVKSPR